MGRRKKDWSLIRHYIIADYRRGTELITSVKFDSEDLRAVRIAARSVKKKLGLGKGCQIRYCRVIGSYWHDLLVGHPKEPGLTNTEFLNLNKSK